MPSDENISEWIKQFEDISNNREPGLYAIIGEDRARGQKTVLRVFEVGGAPESGQLQEDGGENEAQPDSNDGAILLLPVPGSSDEMLGADILNWEQNSGIIIEQPLEDLAPVDSENGKAAVSLLDNKAQNESTVSISMLAVGGLLWLNGFRNRRRQQSENSNNSDAETVSYSREARRKRKTTLS